MAKTRGAEVLSFSSFKPESLRGRAGFFRVGQTTAGQWWFIDPHDRPFFMKAVAAVNLHGRAAPPSEQRGAYASTADDAVDDDSAEFIQDASRRLHTWKVNTLGPWGEPVLAEDGFQATVVVGFRGAGVPVVHLHGVHLPDVFDPRWPSVCDAFAAAAVGPWAGRTDFVGYYTDDALGWGEPRHDRPSLLQTCLSLEPGFAAYHAAWEFVLAPHGGHLAALAREWGMTLPNKEVVRQRTLADRPLDTAGYLRDQARFAREFAHRYFTTTAAALRRYDPDHLVLGCRFMQPPEKAVLGECAYPQVDVVSWQCPAPDFQTQVETYAGEAGMPVLLTACGRLNDRFRTGPFNAFSGPTRVERLLRDERRSLAAACVHPAVVGYEWARWADEMNEVPPFGSGLVHADGGEAFEHTELLTQINARAERLRLRAARGR
jgi:hypothetical protein